MKLTEEQATKLIQEDLLDISLDMLTSSLHDGDIDVAKEWLHKTNVIWLEEDFSNMTQLMREMVTSIDNDPEAVIDWLLGMFVEQRSVTNEV